MLNIFHLLRIYIYSDNKMNQMYRPCNIIHANNACQMEPRNSTMQKQSRKKYDDAVRKRWNHSSRVSYVSPKTYVGCLSRQKCTPRNVLRVEEKSGRKNWGKRNDREKTTKNNDNFVRVIYRFVPWNEGKRDRKRWCIGMVGRTRENHECS